MASKPYSPPPAPDAPRPPAPPDAIARHSTKTPANLKEQGQQGNTWQNTTHQGYVQDR